jgi:hypothetical protein
MLFRGYQGQGKRAFSLTGILGILIHQEVSLVPAQPWCQATLLYSHTTIFRGVGGLATGWGNGEMHWRLEYSRPISLVSFFKAGPARQPVTRNVFDKLRN